MFNDIKVRNNLFDLQVVTLIDDLDKVFGTAHNANEYNLIQERTLPLLRKLTF